MNLADKIEVNTRYTRSANLERDLNSLSIIDAYLPTPRGVRLLDDVADTLSTKDTPRAWCLIGPYGCGKSSFGLFLHGLFGGDADPIKSAATGALKHASPKLERTFTKQKPWCRVVLTGNSGSLSGRLLVALDKAANNFWKGKPGRKPAVLEDIRQACDAPEIADHQLLEMIDALQAALEKSGSGGLLILIDELGKFLEHEVRQGTGGMFLLQELAERALRGRRANMMLFVFLHQSFDLYTRGMGEQLKNDWAKVQGRFQSISFIEAPEQTLRIIAAAFSNTLPKEHRQPIADQAKKIASALGKAKVLPSSLTEDEAAELFASCYPMHPIALLTLPVLCQRFAQNERTLFSYLGSCEPHGFRDSVRRLKVGEWIHLSEIYDYFIQNQPSMLTDPLTHRRWAEVLTAVDRAEREASSEADDKANSMLQLAKAIGLLNLISGSDGLRASEDVLSQLYSSKRAFRAVIERALKASIVQYRKFNDEYRAWQGTDFDIDERVQLETEKLGNFNLADALLGAIEPIIARRHSINTGSLRYFNIACVDARSLDRSGVQSEIPRIIIFLSEGRDDEAAFHEAHSAAQPSDDVWVLYKSTMSLREAVRDVLALGNVQRSAQELASDPVASREIGERMKAARLKQRDALGSLINQPDLSEWYWRGEALNVPDQSTLQPMLSDVMDDIFRDAPRVRNELINRDILSTQAAAGRNRLFHAMLDHADKPGLGIEKYPPERAIYRSIFEAGKLHVEKNNEWKFVEPKRGDKLNLYPTWRQLDKLFAASESKPMSAEYLMNELAKSPFGLKRGFFPVLFLHYYLVRGHEIAFYDEGVYSPVLTYEHLERMVRRPDLFSFQRFRIKGIRATLLEEYSKAIFGEVRDSLTALDIARPLTTFVLGLDEYTQKTRRLSETTMRVRQAFLLSKSPEKLLFEELPRACGFDENAELANFAESIHATLREMKNAHAGMLEDMRQAFCKGFNTPIEEPLDELRTRLRVRCSGLDQYTVDMRGLILRIVDQAPTDEEWFAGLLLVLGHKPSDKWTDQDRDTAEYRLAEFLRRLLELETLRLHYDRKEQQTDDFKMILIKTLSHEHGGIEEVVHLNEHAQEAVRKIREEIDGTLEKAKDAGLALELVASIAQELLVEHRQPQQTGVDSRDGIREVG